MFARHASSRGSLVPAGGGLLYAAGRDCDDCQFIGLDWALDALRERMTGECETALDEDRLPIAPRRKWLTAASVAQKRLSHS